ncbi:porin [Klebsiella huaxiensis]|uniref:Outer membrane protein F n=1 Tax=Klebsiella huaxiensis TaxID=2153354 RepID=A0A564IKX7_9ENTR|nr:porin [Klebsiella huaxiensis]MDG1644166.1 porin [Klebsiella huaxiensis]QBG07610.1 porin [Klebsiella huaxiensis]VUS46190.1 Outer membrane protein F [Klebsiella huaxiensis]
MKRKVLAILVPALLAAGAANAAEIYNKNGNKLDFYGKMVGEHIMTHDGDNNNSDDTSYARFGVKGETQINSELTGYGQFEYNIKADKPEGAQGSATRLAFAGLKYSDYGSFDYGRNYGVVYDAAGYTDMLVEWGGDGLIATDNFMTQRTNGVATYRNNDFFGMVDGLNFALQYQGKNNDATPKKSNGDGFGFSVNYNIDGFGFVGAYSNSDRTDEQAADNKGENAEVWSLATKYDANNLYASVMYGESQNMTHMELGGFANKTQNIEAVVQYQFDFGLRPSLGYVYAKGKDLQNGKRDADIMNYVELGTWYYFNKNFNVYTAYKFNLVDDEDSAITGASTDDQFAVGITYQF